MLRIFFWPYQKNTVKIAHFWCSLDFQSQKTSTCPYVFQEVDAKKIKGPYELFTFLVCTLHSETNKIKEGRDIFMPENRNDHQGVESDVDNVACNAQRKLFFFTTLHMKLLTLKHTHLLLACARAPCPARSERQPSHSRTWCQRTYNWCVVAGDILFSNGCQRVYSHQMVGHQKHPWDPQTYFIILQGERLCARVTQNCHQALAMIREAQSDPPVSLQNNRLHHEAGIHESVCVSWSHVHRSCLRMGQACRTSHWADTPNTCHERADWRS